MVKIIKQFSFLLAIVTFFNCTNNPFDNDEVSTRGQKIKGTVALDDNASPNNVYVWLSGVEVGTFTDADGKFDLRLPTSNAQSGGGISGHFFLYFYVANYSLDSVSVAIRKGVVQTGQGGINDNGELEKTIRLKKLLNVYISASPTSFPYFTENSSIIQEYCDIYTGFEEPFVVLVDLTSLSNSLFIKFPNTTTGPASILFLENIKPDQQFTKRIAVSETIINSSLVSQELNKEFRSWIGSFKLEADMLPPGQYRIIPYFFVQQNIVPQALMESLYLSNNTPGLDFVNIPMKHNSIILEIK
ncbi:hypothetical protein H8E88_31000 [candidate division KSB1 bacterium]|nr:hypothetical protein [candidate division KSB1 bacterium]